MYDIKLTEDRFQKKYDELNKMVSLDNLKEVLSNDSSSPDFKSFF